jgi:hypothetical protein
VFSSVCDWVCEPTVCVRVTLHLLLVVCLCLLVYSCLCVFVCVSMSCLCMCACTCVCLRESMCVFVCMKACMRVRRHNTACGAETDKCSSGQRGSLCCSLSPPAHFLKYSGHLSTAAVRGRGGEGSAGLNIEFSLTVLYFSTFP